MSEVPTGEMMAECGLQWDRLALEVNHLTCLCCEGLAPGVSQSSETAEYSQRLSQAAVE